MTGAEHVKSHTVDLNLEGKPEVVRFATPNFKPDKKHST